ncbi:MAG TPA: hypothetical protein VMB34_24940, partial [Acetobacteraceae bacterium]|nr:hypothetical protein [Acetobacteraceae bacterium]
MDQAIREKRQELEELTHRTELARAHLDGLLAAASLRPESRSCGLFDDADMLPAASLRSESQVNGGSPRPAGRPASTIMQTEKKPRGRGGRSHGMLTAPYRRLVCAMVERGNPLMDSFAISALAHEIGLNLSPKRAGDRFRKYSFPQRGVAERVGDEYRISQAAIVRYGFMQT